MVATSVVSMVHGHLRLGDTAPPVEPGDHPIGFDVTWDPGELQFDSGARQALGGGSISTLGDPFMDAPGLRMLAIGHEV